MRSPSSVTKAAMMPPWRIHNSISSGLDCQPPPPGKAEAVSSNMVTSFSASPLRQWVTRSRVGCRVVVGWVMGSPFFLDCE